MKKVLITGAAGVVGKETLKSLLTEGKYEITIVDLPNLNTKEVFKAYKKRVELIYGDLTNQTLVEELVKSHDIIIDLAGLNQEITGVNENLANIVEHTITENFVRAINYYKPKCHYIYASTTSVYGDKIKNYTVNSKVIQNQTNQHVNYKIKSENLIREKMNNYTIVRLPLVLSKVKSEKIIYNVRLNSEVSLITKEDAGYLFAKVVEHKEKYIKETINASSNESFNMLYEELIKKLIKCNALSFNMLYSMVFYEKNYYSPVVNDASKFNDVLAYQNDDVNNYFNRIAYSNRKKYVSKYLGKVILKIWKKRK